MSLSTITLILFLIMDPIGNVSSFLTLVKGIEAKRVYRILAREMLIALAFMVAFNFFGEYILTLLDISKLTLLFASALILFLTAIKILFPASNSLRANLPRGEPFIIPLAVPLIAGPSLLATIMLFAGYEHDHLDMLFGILIAWVASVVILLNARTLQYYMGNNGLMACERLMGMILVMLSVQRFMEGVRLYIANHYA